MDKYRMFKNYMYNDLGITKEDIQNWTKEAVTEVAYKYIANHISEYDIDRGIRIAIEKCVEKILPSVVIKIVQDQFQFYVVKKEDKSNG